MEIVKNAEQLESQIIQDARSKARRLLEAADRECEAMRAEAEARLQEEIGRVDRSREARMETLRRELAASLPLDFRRTRLAFLQESLEKALAAYLGGLSSPEVGTIVGRQLARAASAFADRRIVVQHAGLDAAHARRIAGENLRGVTVENAVEMTAEDAEAAVKGLIVECSDRSRRCRATLGELTLHLMEDNREELVTALFGKDANT